MNGTQAAKVQRNNSPRVRMALRLLHGGAVRTLKEAGDAVGVHPSYLSLCRNHSPVVKAYVAKLEADIDAGAVNMSAVIQELGRRGLQKIAAMMESDDVKDDLRLKAAQDLADRSPETSKTSKFSIEGDVTMRSVDVAALMKAMAEGQEVEKEFDKQVSNGDYIKVDSEVKYLPPVSLDPGG